MRAVLYPLLFLFLTPAFPQTPTPSEGKLERMATGYAYAASLAWSAADSTLYLADRPAGVIVRITSTGANKLPLKIQAGGLAADSESRLWISDAQERRVLRMDKRGKQEVLASQYEGKPFNGPSDIAVTRSGHAFFVDPAWASADEKKALPYYGIFHVSNKGVVSLAAKLTTRPGGIAIAPDGKTLYASLADAREVHRWTLDRDGAITGQQPVVTRLEGVPDGLAVGPDGRIYVTAREVFVYSPEGKLVDTIHMPEKPTDCKFGEDGSTLFISTDVSLYRWRREAQGASH